VVRLISSAFLHEPPGSGLGILHILFNMWAADRRRPGAGALAGASCASWPFTS